MGQSHSVVTEIEIAASPAAVRSRLLDFAGYKEWHPDWTLTTHDTSKSGVDLRPGDKISCDMKGTKFSPVINENSENALKWTGDLLGLFVGTHQFYYHPSQKTPGGTTFIQREDFTGPLSYFVREGSGGGISTRANFERLNSNLAKSFEQK
ncbi:hypothetical protein B0J11DRAFT_525872 [Dendryphion nanum]|uniref:SRPBCC domain-containing protein n=1 Tax=Dendryphion nanum TaxID=256645 RepID=A0A9P9IRV4_9PLEO|nr:hypothetical protein B0J11DRAFT_525872 [Dendryphion nanum]